MTTWVKRWRRNAWMKLWMLADDVFRSGLAWEVLCDEMEDSASPDTFLESTNPYSHVSEDWLVS